jgi:hypothetical protein
VALPGLQIGSITFGAHTLPGGHLGHMCGYQAMLFHIFAKAFAIAEGLFPASPQMLASIRS